MASVPFALVGSVWLLWALGYNLSVAVWVGLIALAGVAAEIAVILLVYLDQAYRRHEREDRLRNRAELLEAVREGGGAGRSGPDDRDGGDRRAAADHFSRPSNVHT